MSPAGAGAARYIRKSHRGLAWGVLLAVGFVGLLFIPGGGSAAHASTRAPVAALSPAWAEFQVDCVAGPSPGQGSAPASCRCWESNLAQAEILPAYAVDALDAAQVGGGPAYTVGENLSGGMVGDAMEGCGLYHSD